MIDKIEAHNMVLDCIREYTNERGYPPLASEVAYRCCLSVALVNEIIHALKMQSLLIVTKKPSAAQLEEVMLEDILARLEAHKQRAS